MRPSYPSLISSFLIAAAVATAIALVPATAFAHGATHLSPNQPHDNWVCAPYNGSDFCNGVDPQASGCAKDATTVASFVVKPSPGGTTLAYDELRWSAACGTNWVRMTPSVSAYSMTAKIQNYCNGSPTYSKQLYNPPVGVPFWTPMIYAPHNSVSMTGIVNSYITTGCY